LKRLFGISLFVLAVAFACSAQLTIPMGGTGSSDSNRKAPRNNSRLLTGTVTDKGSDKPIAQAIVYLKNTKTLVMKTYIAQNDGSYRFPELSPNIDYEVYAEKNGKKSSTKTLSQFDDRPASNINLQINTNK
jgi:Carboxypeptidase regulatory-like domain